MKLTILAVVDVPDVVANRSNDALLDDVATALGAWRTHDDVGRFSANVQFATVARGVSDAAEKAGYDHSSHDAAIRGGR